MRGFQPSRWAATLLDEQAIGNVAGGCSTGFSDCFKAPRVLATNRGKVMERRNANPWLEDTSQKVVGLNPRAGKGFFSNEICVQCACMIILFWNFYIIQV